MVDLRPRKPVAWLGDSREAARDFPNDAKYVLGAELDLIQLGLNPTNWKPIKTVGAGVSEIRVVMDNQYRVLYVAKFKEAIYVLHAFAKKTQKTSAVDLALATRRYRDLLNMRRDNV